MIDPEHGERLRAAFEAWSRGERGFDPTWTHPEVEIHTAAGDFTGTIYRGREGVERWIADMEEAFDEWRLELHELEEVTPTRVLAIGAVHLRGRGSGATVDQPCAWLLDHVDGVMTRFEPFLNRVDEAREAARR